jgi:dephospho-CoA kinase
VIKLGLTGGIGSGKSMVSSLLEVMNIPVYVADTESKRLVDSSPSIRSRLIALLGESIYTGDKVDRKRLAACIFQDAACLQQVNAIIHPEVNRHFLDWAARQTVALCAIETAILFESGFDRCVDCSLMVYAPLEMRIGRVILRDGLSCEEALARINSQLSDELKKNYADYIIYNDGRQALLPQVAAILGRLTARLGGGDSPAVRS